jgi:xylulokinase
VDPGEKIGEVSAEVSELTGLVPGTALCTGTGDQQCAALGAGVIEGGKLH